jgi:cytochrome d ubiquinol oxidase subunit I
VRVDNGRRASLVNGIAMESSSFSALDLARIQFAFTVSFHIVFPALSIGLASFIAVLEWRWLKTGKAYYKDLCLFWSKIFAVAFGMGVVSGVVMAYEFGTNWGGFRSSPGRSQVRC